MSRFLAVAVGGALGAMSRYAVVLFVATFWKRDFPLATLLINVSGSFVLGFFATVAAEKSSLDPLWRLLIATGFIGAYTTFSTFEYETQRLTESGALWWGALNVLTSVAAGYAAVQFGIFLARR
ncbi:MAG TPA: fluoride efflux transporter CrcB [Thermoanaerobaculia bacterium]|nr:fluoride efflux transporter CrcB [Thermoanaerobaculia bacterium]